jgi:hypothetical protein
MISACMEDVVGFLMKPRETFKKSKDRSLGCAFEYYVGLLIIFSILFTIVSIALGVAHFNTVVSQVAMIPFIGKALAGSLSHFSGFVAVWKLFAAYALFLILLFGIFLIGFMYHVFVLLFGGEKGVVQTVRTTMFAATPALLFGWIPYIWTIGLLWAAIIFIIGISETQEISTGRGVAVIVVPLVLKLIFIGLGAAVIVSFMGALAGILPRPF